MPPPTPTLHVGDRVELRKPHPCGGLVWSITRIGADLGLRCETCGHHVFLQRSVFNKQYRKHAEPSQHTTGPAGKKD